MNSISNYSNTCRIYTETVVFIIILSVNIHPVEIIKTKPLNSRIFHRIRILLQIATKLKTFGQSNVTWQKQGVQKTKSFCYQLFW